MMRNCASENPYSLWWVWIPGSLTSRAPNDETGGCESRKQKGPTDVGPLICCARPGPDDPGGLGAEESETERTGPTQCILLAIQRGSRLAEKGLYCDSANDPVTALVVQFQHSHPISAGTICECWNCEGPLE